MIAIATPTVMDGLVVRWYRSEDAAENGCELMSVSRNGISIKCFLHQVPEDVLATAKWAHEQLAAGRAYEQVRALATHRRKHLLGCEIEPVPTDARADAGIATTSNIPPTHRIGRA